MVISWALTGNQEVNMAFHMLNLSTSVMLQDHIILKKSVSRKSLNEEDSGHYSKIH